MNLRSTTKYFLSLASLSLILVGLFSQPTHAANVSKEKSFSISGYSQGATLTKDYYVFTEWNKGANVFKVTRCKRSNAKSCKSTSYYNGKPASMYHKWGTDYAQAILRENSGMYCFKISSMEKVSDKKCGSMVRSDGLNISGDNQSVRQGWTKYGKYYLRGYGNNGGMKNYIWLFNSNKKNIKEWPIPLSGAEVEDVMVDGDTGQVWFTYGNAGSIAYYKVAKSVFNKWIKASGSSSSSSTGSSSSSSSSDIYSDKPYDPAADGLAVRDETFKPEVTESTYDGTVDTTFFGTIQDDKEGCGVYTVLQFIIDLLTIGIGVAAVLGIVISGILYLTARGNVAQTTKAKRRIYEIVMGLVAYVALYAITSFLLPTINPEFKTCRQVSEQSAEQTTEQTTTEPTDQ